MLINSVAVVLNNLKFIFNLKNDIDVSEFLSIPKTSLSTMKNRNSVGVAIEKIALIEENVSFDALFLSQNEEQIKCHQLAREVISSIENDKIKLQKLQLYLKDFLHRQNILLTVLPLIQTMKGKDFYSIISELNSGDGERMLLVLNYFLIYLQDKNIEFENIKGNFIKALVEYQPSHKDRLRHMYAFGDEDKERLLKWAKDNLDELACYEIITSIPTILTAIKSKVNFINKGFIKQ